jgi:hypothetical protein
MMHPSSRGGYDVFDLFVNPWRRRASALVAWVFIAAALGLVLAGLVAIASAAPARAGELSREQVAVVYAIAYGHVGGQLPQSSPRIILVDRVLLQAMRCGGAECGVRGWTRGADIFLDQALDFSDPAGGAGVLLHELVHFLQGARWGPARDCFDNLERERQAYRIQAHELERLGRSPASALQALGSMGCG